MDKKSKQITEAKDIEKILKMGKTVIRKAFFDKKLEKKIKKFSNY